MSRVTWDSYVETYVTIIREVEDDDGVGTPIPTEIYDVLEKYTDLIPEEFPKVLPPRHEMDHNIKLELGKEPPEKSPYLLLGPKLEALKRQLKDLVDAGFIQPSRSPYGAPVFFQKKKYTNELRMCCDYRALNK